MNKFFIILLILIIISCLLVKSNIENFETFSSTQKIGYFEQKVIDRGLSSKAKLLLNTIPLINYPSKNETKKEIETILKYQKTKNKFIHYNQLLDEIIISNKFDEISATYEEEKKMVYFFYNIVDPIIFHLKLKYDRVRPSFFDERVNNWIDVPEHPSYPSGHSVQSHVIAYLMGKKYPEKRKFYEKIANRISVNREIGGLHYPSDTEYGKIIARHIVDNSNYTL
tara:strand:+ start:149 stop:823 length:675 start_codon:yes stop_codon:yes gene_type:complete